MNNEKLMQIVQAVNDSKSEPHDIRQPDYHYVAYSTGAQRYQKGEVHAVNNKATEEYWDIICTIEEFNQCTKEMGAGYGKKESSMGKNKHPHYNLIAEWNENNNVVFQMKPPSEHIDWQECNIHALIQNPSFSARIKPREFVKGHWYPCVEKGEKASKGYPRIFNGVNFADWEDDTCLLDESEFEWIGESLGEIKFGGGE